MRRLRGKPRRTGIIPYTVIDSTIYCLLGVDRQSDDYSDFGGGRKKNESFAMGAVRECSEETESVITLTPEIIEDFTAIWCDRIGIIFVPILLTKTEMESLSMSINQKLILNEKSEMLKVEWITWNQLITLVLDDDTRTHKLYTSIRELLYIDFCKPFKLHQTLINKYNLRPLMPSECVRS